MTRKFYRSFSVLLAAFAAIVTLGAPASTLAQTQPLVSRTETAAPAAQTPPAAPIAAQPASGAPAAAGPSAQPGAQPGTQGASTDGYVLGINDRVRVLVFGEQSLSGEFLVDSTGRIAMPFIGEVQAAGLTRRQLEEDLEKKLSAEEILLDPRVSVDFLNLRPYYILGEVTKPGEYPYTQGLNVFNAVATAGGFTTLANQTRIMIKRQGEAVETEYSLLSPVTVQPGDTIRVIKGAFYILGEVNRPGEYAFSEGLTVQNAVATAGGFTYRANTRQVFVKHRNEAQERRVQMSASLPVQPGDTIRITERFF
ncbi:MAG: polysaccharide export outer membrane protein [Caulobacteraceae bacterium]|nr:MAG: polysaccharide export outer membrane protein [Caulobacteraceae bacterium]